MKKTNITALLVAGLLTLPLPAGAAAADSASVTPALLSAAETSTQAAVTSTQAAETPAPYTRIEVPAIEIPPPTPAPETPSTTEAPEAPSTPEAPETPAPSEAPSPVPNVIEESWFDDAVFIGDSFVGSLFNANMINGGLGDAQICYFNGLSCHIAAKKGSAISYMGDTHSISEVVELSGAAKVFLLIACNDVGQTRETMDPSWDWLIADIRAHSPEVEIFIQGCLPIYMETGYMNNENITELNGWLLDTCERNGCTYVTVSDSLTDEKGFMKAEYSLEGLHCTREACGIWIENLKNPSNYTVFAQA